MTLLYHITVQTLHRINEAHDLRPYLRRWTGCNDNCQHPPAGKGRAIPSPRAPHLIHSRLTGKSTPVDSQTMGGGSCPINGAAAQHYCGEVE